MWPLLLSWYIWVAQLTLYKIPHLHQLIEESGTYYIFPWNRSQVSSSSHYWLLIHIVVALVHLALSILVILREDCQPMQTMTHWLFTGLVLINIHHFGEATLPVALLGNGTPLLIMLISQQRWPWIYLLALSSAPLLEMILYVLY